MSLTDSYENVALNALLGTGHVSGTPNTVYWALFTGDPGDTGAATNEVGAGVGYARVAQTNNTTNFPAASGGQKTNGTKVEFANPTGSWGTITHWGLCSSATIGAATVILRGSLDVSKTPGVGSQPYIQAGEITITMS